MGSWAAIQDGGSSRQLIWRAGTLMQAPVPCSSLSEYLSRFALPEISPDRRGTGAGGV